MRNLKFAIEDFGFSPLVRAVLEHVGGTVGQIFVFPLRIFATSTPPLDTRFLAFPLQSAAWQRMMNLYDSISPVLRYDEGLLYDQVLPAQKVRSRMARAKSGVHLLSGSGLMQFLQTIITAATGNPNAPTPTSTLVELQELYDDGATKINAVDATKALLAAQVAARDAHFALVRKGITAFINYAEVACDFDPVKLQTLGLPLRSPASAPLPCDTVMGLVTSTGDEAEAMSAYWGRQVQADFYEVQISTDPINGNTWTPAANVSEPKVALNGLPSGQKRWLRVRAVNRKGAGPWSDPSCRMIP